MPVPRICTVFHPFGWLKVTSHIEPNGRLVHIKDVAHFKRFSILRLMTNSLKLSNNSLVCSGNFCDIFVRQRCRTRCHTHMTQWFEFFLILHVSATRTQDTFPLILYYWIVLGPQIYSFSSLVCLVFKYFYFILSLLIFQINNLYFLQCYLYNFINFSYIYIQFFKISLSFSLLLIHFNIISVISLLFLL